MKKTFLPFILAAAFAGTPHTVSAQETEVRPAEAVEESGKDSSLFERLFKKRETKKEPEPETNAEPDATPPVRKAKPAEAPTKKAEVSEAPTKKGIAVEAPTKKAIATEASETVEETPTPKPKPRKSRSKPKPAATPEEAETPSATPAKTPVKKATPTPAPTPEPTPDLELEPAPTPTTEIDPSRLQEPLPFAPAPEPKVAATPAGPDILDPEYVEKSRKRYEEVRTEAEADGKVAALKEEADAAFEPGPRAEALKTYYKALFAKMRKIEPSIKKRIDSREEMTLRRIESITPANE